MLSLPVKFGNSLFGVKISSTYVSCHKINDFRLTNDARWVESIVWVLLEILKGVVRIPYR